MKESSYKDLEMLNQEQNSIAKHLRYWADKMDEVHEMMHSLAMREIERRAEAEIAKYQLGLNDSKHRPKKN